MLFIFTPLFRRKSGKGTPLFFYLVIPAWFKDNQTLLQYRYHLCIIADTLCHWVAVVAVPCRTGQLTIVLIVSHRNGSVGKSTNSASVLWRTSLAHLAAYPIFAIPYRQSNGPIYRPSTEATIFLRFNASVEQLCDWFIHPNLGRTTDVFV